MSKFYNPYNFIPLGKPLDGMLGQGKPAGHDRYGQDLWSGRIEIEIKTATPLLIPDAARAKPNDEETEHKIFAVRKGPDGKPLLPPTSLKGALRSAYEAVTNSRLPFFEGHDAPPARRMRTQQAADLIPARVVSNGAGKAVELWYGATRGRPNPHNRQAVHAAWLPVVGPRSLSGVLEFKPSDDCCLRGMPVTIRVQRIEHKRWNKAQQQHQRDFDFWEVVSIVQGHNNFAQLDQLARSKANGAVRPRSSAYTPTSDFEEGNGYVSWSNRNIDRKHDERVFFVKSGQEPLISSPLSAEICSRWTQLIKDYKAVYERDGRRQDVPETSRHITVPGSEGLEDGTLCYAKLVAWPSQGTPQVTSLYPVMISRELGFVSPAGLLQQDARPALKLEELSPADRVFGWVNKKGKGAYKGQLRIHSIDCANNSAIECFEPPLPLAILSAPKVSQSRFYIGSKDGAPLDSSSDLATSGYFDKSNPKGPKQWGLRGRKVYPHHAAISEMEDYWDREKGSRDASESTVNAAGTAGGSRFYREYLRRPDGDKGNADKQNRSIREWVKPETTFTAIIDVINLNIAELGVLLWLLDLNGRRVANEPQDGCLYHRLGGGKPLGFGSVKISIRSVDLCTGAAKRAQYRAFFGAPDYSALAAPFAVTGNAKSALELIEKAEEAFGTPFVQLPNAPAFLAAARGHRDHPVHYPRTEERPNPAGENFKWFGANENGGHGSKPLRLALPALADGEALPLKPTT